MVSATAKSGISRYFEDLVVGETHRSAPYEVTEQAVLDFARQYDPQYFHADPDAAAHNPIFQGLTASGIHTTAIWRLLDHQILGDVAWVCGLGWDEVRWKKPVRPGDKLVCTAELLEKKDWKRPGIGWTRWRHELVNQKGEMVFGYYGLSLVEKRGG